jgi:hypothetical protein
MEGFPHKRKHHEELQTYVELPFMHDEIKKAKFDHKYITPSKGCIINGLIENEYECSEELSEYERRYIIYAIVILEALITGKCNKMVTMNGNLARADKFKNILNEINDLLNLNINICHVERSTDSYNINQTVDKFVNSKKAIFIMYNKIKGKVALSNIDSYCLVDNNETEIIKYLPVEIHKDQYIR